MTFRKKISLLVCTHKESYAANVFLLSETREQYRQILIFLHLIVYNYLQWLIWAIYESRGEKYIPSPLRCARCQKFGHHFSKCRNSTAICCRCGCPQPEMSHNLSTSGALIKCDYCDKDHSASPKPTKCIFCKGPHPAFSKQCPKKSSHLNTH